MSYGSRKRGYDKGGCVRGVDRRLRRITTNLSQTLRRRLVWTTDATVCATLAAVRSRLYFSHLVTRTVDNTVDLYAAKPDIRPESRFCLPNLHSTPPLGGFLSEYRHSVWYGKTGMVWLHVVEKISKTCLLVLTWSTNVTDRRTDRQTDTAWRHIGRAFA